MPEFEAIANRTKKIRESMNESQMDFASHCGISVETLSLIEREKTDVRLSTLQKIAAYSDMTVSDLLEVEEKEKHHEPQIPSQDR